jgi:hypothetical protein
MKKALPLIVLLCGVLSSAVFGLTGPRIQFDRTEYDFGNIVHPESAAIELSFSNTGDEELVVERISSSCGCAKALRGSRTLTPGSSSTIQAQIETLGMLPGSHMKTVMVHTNDSAHPATCLRLKFNVVRHLSVLPEMASTGVLASETHAVLPLRAVNHWTEPITLRAVPSPDGEGAVLIPQDVLVPASGKVDFQLRISVNQADSRRYIKGIAFLETTDPLAKTVPVHYFIQLQKTNGQ